MAKWEIQATTKTEHCDIVGYESGKPEMGFLQPCYFRVPLLFN